VSKRHYINLSTAQDYWTIQKYHLISQILGSIWTVSSLFKFKQNNRANKFTSVSTWW